MFNVLIWGTRYVYNQYANLIKLYERDGQFRVVGITSNDRHYSSLDGYPFVKKHDLRDVQYDFILVCVTKPVLLEVRLEAKAFGIPEDKLISVYVLSIPNFNFDKYVKLSESKVSILANNCWGGVCCKEMGLKVRSPFYNMFETDVEYVRFLADVKDVILNEKLSFQKMKYNEVLNIDYPVFKLGDMHIYMNHYPDRNEAEKKWYERVERINWDNLFVMMFTENVECVEMFSHLPFQKKICFTSLDMNIPSAFYLSTDILDPDKQFWEIVHGTALNIYHLFDPVELLLSGQIVRNRTA